MASTRFFILCPLIVFSLVIAPSAGLTSTSKVSVTLYYESLCPYSANFIVNYVAKFFDNGLISIIDLELVPYGNAKIKSDGTITCQHGPFECLLNTVEACAINAWPDLNDHFSFIYCVESLVMTHKYVEWESCFQETGLNSEPVLDCYKNGYGKKLELEYAGQTDSLQPPHKYVPWVVVDGQPIYEDLLVSSWDPWIQIAFFLPLLLSQDYEDVDAYICKAYEGELPEACKELTLLITPESKANRARHVSRIDNILAPVQLARDHGF